MTQQNPSGPVDRDVGHDLPLRGPLDPRYWKAPNSELHAKLDRLRAENEALRSLLSSTLRWVPNDDHTEHLRERIRDALPPNAALCGHRTEDTK